jgi:trigger factor
MEFPPVLVDMEVDRMVSQHLEQLKSNATSPEEYMQWLKRKPEAEIRQEYQPLATKRIAGSLVLSKVAEAEKIEVSDAEVDAEIERMTASSGDMIEEQKKFLNSPQARNSIRQLLATRRTIQRLSELAQGSPRKERTKKEAK